MSPALLCDPGRRPLMRRLVPPSAPPAGSPDLLSGEFWRVPKVARFLDVSSKRIYQLIEEGRIKCVRLGPRQTRIPKSAVLQYLRELLDEDAPSS
ncbi:helix-turn-helix domain-containing protein [Candidatus Sumerlaeota bacterium]|nr:helix-turn-helix domain-containing protein [Candidatus Sumerlaeota bacterium]